MKVYENSLHAKLYKFTYNNELPNNLCPYFWKLVFSSLIFIPNFLLQLPTLIINIFSSNKSNDCGDNRSVGLAVWLALFILFLYGKATYNMILAMLHSYYFDSKFANAGVAINIAFIVVAIFLVSKYFYNSYKKKKTIANGGLYTEEEETPSIIAEFFKAKYNKYCPKLEWEKKQFK